MFPWKLLCCNAFDLFLTPRLFWDESFPRYIYFNCLWKLFDFMTFRPLHSGSLNKKNYIPIILFCLVCKENTNLAIRLILLEKVIWKLRLAYFYYYLWFPSNREYILSTMSVDILGFIICIGQQTPCSVIFLTGFCYLCSEHLSWATVIRNIFCSSSKCSWKFQISTSNKNCLQLSLAKW